MTAVCIVDSRKHENTISHGNPFKLPSPSPPPPTPLLPPPPYCFVNQSNEILRELLHAGCVTDCDLDLHKTHFRLRPSLTGKCAAISAANKRPHKSQDLKACCVLLISDTIRFINELRACRRYKVSTRFIRAVCADYNIIHLRRLKRYTAYSIAGYRSHSWLESEGGRRSF